MSDVIGPFLKETLRRLEDFEASGTVPNTGTGARSEGAQFETHVKNMWTAFARDAVTLGAVLEVVGVDKRRYAKLSICDRALIVPIRNDNQKKRDTRWLEVSFDVKDMVESYPGTSTVINKYAPSLGKFSGERYPRMYSGLTTKFDDTILLIDGGILHEKILLEYKTAKSSKKTKIDGNAHERLSFQIMQYLEVATRYTRCSLMIMANGAFVRYRNKYHVNFHVQADRLKNFCWFKMDYACTFDEYSRFLESLLAWLFYGSKRTW